MIICLKFSTKQLDECFCLSDRSQESYAILFFCWVVRETVVHALVLWWRIFSSSHQKHSLARWKEFLRAKKCHQWSVFWSWARLLSFFSSQSRRKMKKQDEYWYAQVRCFWLFFASGGACTLGGTFGWHRWRITLCGWIDLLLLNHVIKDMHGTIQ